MAHNPETTSPYYPPRARWYSRFLYPGAALRRHLHLETIHLPDGLSPFQVFLSIVIPSFAFFTNGRRVLGWSFLATYLLAGLIFIVALGYTMGGFAFGIMIAVHATSIVFLESYWLRESGFGLRVCLALGTLAVVWGAVYSPLIRFAERHWVMPLRIGERVIIVSRRASPQTLKRGDWVAYRIQRSSEGELHIRSGLDLAPVLALAGDRVEFTSDTYTVNGVHNHLLDLMPSQGEMTVPEKHWFVWPQIAIGVRRNVPDTTVSSAMLQIGMVSQEEIVGTPFKKWFWREQVWQHLP